jgi:DNA-binding CsgD family transcriptional regulator
LKEQHHVILGTIANLLSISLEPLLAFPCHIFWKDLQGVYAGYNNYGANSLGYHNGDEIVGKTDYEIFSHDIAAEYVKNDRIVLREEKQFCFQERGILSNDNPIVFLSYKAPMYNQDKQLMGILGLAFVQSAGSVVSCQIERKLSIIEAAISRRVVENRNSLNFPLLSENEKKCLVYLCKGLTVKMIARQMKISPHTVETYMQRAKVKMNCRNKAQMILAFTKQYGY